MVRPLGIYLHVPYCARRCGYCAFNTYAVGDDGDHDAQERFVEGAAAELDLAVEVLGHERPLTGIFVGGGTPTMLTDDQMTRLLDAVRARFPVPDDLEVTVEANPDGLRPGQLGALREAGATRVSFGMQSLSRRVLQLLDRTHDPERALRAVDEARAAGFVHVSLDLIYGTPSETTQDWADTLEAVCATPVDHVSAYALGIEAGTKLAARVRRGELPTPDDDEAADRYVAADERLSAAGFEWYEISNWARSPDARCRHNLLYWRNHDWWGIGPGAHSHLDGVRWWNHDDPGRWADAAAAGRSPEAGREVLTGGQRRLEDVMLGVRLAEGVALDETSQRSAEQLERDGLADAVGGRVRLTRPGRLLADHVVGRLTR